MKKLHELKTVFSLRRCLFGLVLILAVAAVSGCHTVSFYGQALKGQYQIFAHEEPIQKLLTDATIPPKLHDRFVVLEELRTFARQSLKLPVDGHYQKYVDLHRPYVVWNVEAAPEFSMAPKTWWYPLLGSLEYRGYFSRGGATNYAATLKEKGYDVSVGGVEAYSTLGWFKDPVLNTFVFEPDADLAEIIFHELGHQRVFAHGDTDFNEAFATTVGEEGAKRWLKAKGRAAQLTQYLAHLERTRDFAHLIMNTRTRLEMAYGDEKDAEGKIRANRKKQDLSNQSLRQQKQAILADLQREYSEVKARWQGNDEYDGWFARPINNARLNAVAAYYDFVPGFEQILDENGGDLERFYAAVQKLSTEPKDQRHAALKKMALARQAKKAALRARNLPGSSGG